jgi:hypothetical protein
MFAQRFYGQNVTTCGLMPASKVHLQSILARSQQSARWNYILLNFSKPDDRVEFCTFTTKDIPA